MVKNRLGSRASVAASAAGNRGDRMPVLEGKPMGKHRKSMGKMGKKIRYPQVNCHVTMEHHHFWMGKSTISMAMFNSYVWHNQRVMTWRFSWGKFIDGRFLADGIPIPLWARHPRCEIPRNRMGHGEDYGNGCVTENVVKTPKNPMVLLIIIPFLNG